MSNVSVRPIVVGVDGSESGRHVVSWAAVQARRRGTSLRLVHSCEVPVGYPPAVTDAHTLRSALEEQGRTWLEEAREVAEQSASGLQVDVVLEVAAPIVTLLKESRNADQIVVGSRGLGGFTGLLVGSTSVELAAHAHCPVVVVRARHVGDMPPSDGPVVVGVDGTPVGEAAIEFAYGEASRRETDLIAVHAWNDLLETAFAASGAALDSIPLAEQAEETLAERLAGWQEKNPDVHVTREVVREGPTRALLKRAEHAQLVVVGTRGRGGFRGLLLGSTSQHLLHHAPCPVAVVRTQPS